jgi:hypothetical protein
VSVRGANSKQWEVPNIASKNTKTNNFQEGHAGFKVTVDLNNNNNNNVKWLWNGERIFSLESSKLKTNKTKLRGL